MTINKNPRINVTIKPKLLDTLNMVADKEHCSVSSLTKELIIEALERRIEALERGEDISLSAIADLRDNEPTINHDKAWRDIKVVTVNLDIELYNELSKFAEDTFNSRSSVINQALYSYFCNKEIEEAKFNNTI